VRRGKAKGFAPLTILLPFLIIVGGGEGGKKGRRGYLAARVGVLLCSPFKAKIVMSFGTGISGTKTSKLVTELIRQKKRKKRGCGKGKKAKGGRVVLRELHVTGERGDGEKKDFYSIWS